MSAEDVIAEEQQHAADKALLDKFLDLFKADEDATFVLMGFADGLSRNEICQLGEMDSTRYESTRTRIRRARDKHFPQGWNS